MENMNVTVTETNENGERIVTATVRAGAETFGLCELLEKQNAIPSLSETLERAVRAGVTEYAKLGELFLKVGTKAMREHMKKESPKSAVKNGGAETSAKSA
jgi:biotin synthase-related radical SAM superfamily protein